MTPMHTEIYKDHTIKIYQDEDSENPREWDNLGTMVCFHGRYNLGDEHTFSDTEQLAEYMNEHVAVKLPLYLYDHSGITMKTSPFFCKWDSVQVGYIVVTAEKLKTEGMTTKQAKKALENEVETYNHYLQGDVYGFVISQTCTCPSCENEHEMEGGSLWGIYGLEYAIQEAKSEIDNVK